VSYLVRAGRSGPPTPGQAAWLDRVVQPALATARKGGLVSAQEQLDFVAELADLSPDYAVGSVVTEMLQVGGGAGGGFGGAGASARGRTQLRALR
jgi:hypothetical protein